MKQVFLLALLAVSCYNKDSCEVDTAFKKQFNENVNFLISTESKGDFIYQTSEKIKAIYFLESTTGIKSQLYWGHVFGYQSSELLEEDIEKWKNWYDTNKCKMTIVKADSLFRNYKR
jgi:hypothetical protein